ncbi:MAG TPA: NAD-dependent epimerase/dehydratase family protein [Kofleriaceae bacterium]|nr:NAD-dependent epimerase/dehydratase family protein [Kofleriaceae bacterium]
MPVWFVLGAGYTGTRLVERLARETTDEVILTRRDAAVATVQAAAAQQLAAQGTAGVRVRGIAAELAKPETLRGAIPAGAIVVCTAPPGEDPAREIAHLAEAAADAARLIYISSTGVYGPGGGAWVDETWPVAPFTSSGLARAAAEAALPATAIALRAAGIYGPDRSTADRIVAGTYRVVGDGRSHVSRIHVDDLVEAIIRAAAAPTDVRGPINCADDDPAPIGEVADAIAAKLGLPPPPRVDPSKVAVEVAGMLTANRRIANTRMKQELGVVLRYPSWRDALAS